MDRKLLLPDGGGEGDKVSQYSFWVAAPAVQDGEPAAPAVKPSLGAYYSIIPFRPTIL